MIPAPSRVTAAAARSLARHPWQLALSLLGIALGVAVVVANRSRERERAPGAGDRERRDRGPGHPPHHRRAARGAGATLCGSPPRGPRHGSKPHGFRRGSAPRGFRWGSGPCEHWRGTAPCGPRRGARAGDGDPGGDGDGPGARPHGARDRPLRGPCIARRGIRRRASRPLRDRARTGARARLDLPGPGRGALRRAVAGRDDRAARSAGGRQLAGPRDRGRGHGAGARRLAGLARTASTWSCRTGPRAPKPSAGSKRISPRAPGSSIANERRRATARSPRRFELNLAALLGLLAVVVGAFLIFNTMTFSVVRRRWLIGMLRCLGVTRGRIFAAHSRGGDGDRMRRRAGRDRARHGARAGAGGAGRAVGERPLLLGTGRGGPRERRRAVGGPRSSGIAATLAAALVPAREATRIPTGRGARPCDAGGRRPARGRAAWPWPRRVWSGWDARSSG